MSLDPRSAGQPLTHLAGGGVGCPVDVFDARLAALGVAPQLRGTLAFDAAHVVQRRQVWRCAVHCDDVIKGQLR